MWFLVRELILFNFNLHLINKLQINFIWNRFGRNVQVVPVDLDLSAVCLALLSNSVVNNTELHPDVSRVLRLCNGLNKITGEISLDGASENQDVTSHHEWTGCCYLNSSEIRDCPIRPADSMPDINKDS